MSVIIGESEEEVLKCLEHPNYINCIECSELIAIHINNYKCVKCSYTKYVYQEGFIDTFTNYNFIGEGSQIQSISRILTTTKILYTLDYKLKELVLNFVCSDEQMLKFKYSDLSDINKFINLV